MAIKRLCDQCEKEILENEGVMGRRCDSAIKLDDKSYHVYVVAEVKTDRHNAAELCHSCLDKVITVWNQIEDMIRIKAGKVKKTWWRLGW